MRNIDIAVHGQTLQRIKSEPIVIGSKGYLRTVFKFSSDWNGCKKIATFFSEDNKESAIALAADGSCSVPDEVTDGAVWYVKVTGVNRQGKMITTSKLKVRQSI